MYYFICEVEMLMGASTMAWCKYGEMVFPTSKMQPNTLFWLLVPIIWPGTVSYKLGRNSVTSVPASNKHS